MSKDEDHQRQQPTRRLFVGAVAAIAVGGGGAFVSKWFNIFADANVEGALTVEAAFDAAAADRIYLVDIRRPDEWRKTGLSEHAIPLDMRRKDFEAVLQQIFAASGPRPVALICARGVRSDRMNKRLEAAGFSNILDVPEGMLGSGAGPGYIERSLPLRAPTQNELDGQVV